MSRQNPRIISVKPRDFSERRYFPGTPENPYHKIETFNQCISKIPAPIYALVIGCVIFAFTGDIWKSGLIVGLMVTDFLLLSLLPVLKISFGPATLPTLMLALLRMPFLLFNFQISVIFQLLGTFLIIYGFFVEPQFPHVSAYQVSIPSNREKSAFIKIVHISDLHMEYYTKREVRVIEQINRLSPDFVVFTGDFFSLSYQHDQRSLADITRFFSQIDAEFGVFGVTGSTSVDLEESLKAVLLNLNMHLIQDQVADIKVNGLPISLIGLNCTHHPEEDKNRLETLIDTRKNSTNILLYHSPDIAPHIQDLPIDLQLSGHTHGGQVALPFIGPIYTGSLYGLTFKSGIYEILNSHTLIISRGLGLEGEAAPRVRFCSPPEIGLVTLEFIQDNVK